MELAWADRDGAACLRLTGCPPGADLRVVPSEVLAGAWTSAVLPAAAGRVEVEDGVAWFVPRFPFVAGTSYSVLVGEGVEPLSIVRPAPAGEPTTSVLDVWPSGATIPRNHLRLYVRFSAPMSEGFAASRVRVVDDAGGEPLEDALLATDAELWDVDRRRLTILFDPARIKRGLLPHEEAGYPLAVGRAIRVIIDAGFLDATGLPLRSSYERRYEVGPDERRHVDPSGWRAAAPAPGTRQPLVVDFDRPLDHALLLRSVTVAGVAGSPAIGEGERSWAFVPDEPWGTGRFHLVVDHRLEDLAGNSVARVFDRDLRRPEDAPLAAEPVVVPFDVG